MAGIDKTIISIKGFIAMIESMQSLLLEELHDAWHDAVDINDDKLKAIMRCMNQLDEIKIRLTGLVSIYEKEREER